MSYDPAKRRKNQRKHKVDLPNCEAAFDGPMLTREDDREKYGEQRFRSLGWAHGRVVVLIWTDREDGPRLISCREAEPHEQEAYFKEYPPTEAPYDPKDREATLKYWSSATAHRGVAELRAKRGRPPLSPDERKAQIALRVDKDVLEWYRAQGTGWQTRMNAVLKAFRDATR